MILYILCILNIFSYTFILCYTEKELDLNSVDLAKMKVADLKKILDRWGEACIACIEKTDYVQLIRELIPKYTVKSQKADL